MVEARLHQLAKESIAKDLEAGVEEKLMRLIMSSVMKKQLLEDFVDLFDRVEGMERMKGVVMKSIASGR